MGILDHTVECEKRTTIGHNRIIITYDEKASAWCRVASLCRRVNSLFTLSLFLKPKVVRPD